MYRGNVSQPSAWHFACVELEKSSSGPSVSHELSLLSIFFRPCKPSRTCSISRSSSLESRGSDLAGVMEPRTCLTSCCKASLGLYRSIFPSKWSPKLRHVVQVFSMSAQKMCSCSYLNTFIGMHLAVGHSKIHTFRDIGRGNSASGEADLKACLLPDGDPYGRLMSACVSAHQRNSLIHALCHA